MSEKEVYTDLSEFEIQTLIKLIKENPLNDFRVGSTDGGHTLHIHRITEDERMDEAYSNKDQLNLLGIFNSKEYERLMSLYEMQRQKAKCALTILASAIEIDDGEEHQLDYECKVRQAFEYLEDFESLTKAIILIKDIRADFMVNNSGKVEG